MVVPIPAHFTDRADAYAAFLVACNAVVVLGSGLLAWHLGTWWGYAAAFILVGARGQACYILQHELMHNLLFTRPSTNERIGVLLSAILGTQFYIGRKIHWDHHRHVGSAHDPNEAFHNVENRPPGIAVVNFFLFHLFGGRLLTMAQGLLSRASGKPIIPTSKARIDLVALILVQAIALAAITAASSIYVYIFLYVAPLATLTAFFESIRSFSEHVLPGEASCEAEQTRRFMMDAGPVELFFISQFGFHYHHVHHLYPNVVTFKVRALHYWLSNNDPDYAGRYMTRPGYIGTAMRYLRARPFPGAGAGYPSR